MIPVTKRDHLISNDLYDLLKILTTTGLPAITTLYLSLANLWTLPAPVEVAGTISALNVFLGIFLKASTRSYDNSEAKYDGVLDTTPHLDGTPKAIFALNEDPTLLDPNKPLVFKRGTVPSE